mmetsp:Transcript_39311/g.45112  ORF Transcript_39311/g.45112 Transcript_39311/m.45112 type:complete len:121 (-) Transcript_39311:1381-1743(-)
MTRPSLSTMILSEFFTVDKRCAITIVVMLKSPFWNWSMASCTSFSFLRSSADVASSRIRIFGFFTKARARAILCFSPPESCPPPAPTTVSSPSGNLSIILQALALRRAVIICSSVASGLP